MKGGSRSSDFTEAAITVDRWAEPPLPSHSLDASNRVGKSRHQIVSDRIQWRVMNG